MLHLLAFAIYKPLYIAKALSSVRGWETGVKGMPTSKNQGQKVTTSLWAFHLFRTP